MSREFRVRMAKTDTGGGRWVPSRRNLEPTQKETILPTKAPSTVSPNPRQTNFPIVSQKSYTLNSPVSTVEVKGYDAGPRTSRRPTGTQNPSQSGGSLPTDYLPVDQSQREPLTQTGSRPPPGTQWVLYRGGRGCEPVTSLSPGSLNR